MLFDSGASPIVFPGLGGLELNPPKGFSFFGLFEIRFYGVIIALGLLLAVIYGLRRAKQFGLTQDDLLDGVLWITPVAIIFARLYYCVFKWDRFADNPMGILTDFRDGGLAIYGGVIGALIGILVYCKVKKLKTGAVLDVVAIGFLIGQALGRWGNFFNREAFGSETDFFLRMGLETGLSADGQLISYAGGELRYYHPTFLYESLWNLAGFLILHFASKRRKYDGQIALGYVAWYGLGRAIIEGLRTDSLYIPGSEVLRVSQLVAAATCLVAVACLLILGMKKKDPAKLFVNIVKARAEAEEVTEEAEEVVEETEEVAEEAAEEVVEEAAEEATEEAAEEAAEETAEEAEEPKEQDNA